MVNKFNLTMGIINQFILLLESFIKQKRYAYYNAAEKNTDLRARLNF